MAIMKILFICFANTCRSPMAEAIARRHAGSEVEVFSAGHNPTGRVAENTIRTLQDMGIDTSGLASKGFDAVPLDDMDIIVSLMGPQGLIGLPPHLSSEKIAWSIRDPYGEDEASYKATASNLDRRIGNLLKELHATELSIL